MMYVYADILLCEMMAWELAVCVALSGLRRENIYNKNINNDNKYNNDSNTTGTNTKLLLTQIIMKQ